MQQTHVSDERLIEACLEAPSRGTGAAFARGSAERRHLDACAECQARHARLRRVLADSSAIAAAESDALFDDERLARQRARILQRVERDTRPGRVIAFPAGSGPGTSLRVLRPRARWIAGAAAAGLAIGLLAGHLAHELPGREPLPAQTMSATFSEEELLGRLEIAVEATGGSALRPLDDLTPRVWEVAAQ